MKIKSTIGAIMAMSALAAVSSNAAVLITGPSTYTQNFNTLPTTGTTNTFTDNSTLVNWYAQRSGTGSTIIASDGSSTTGGLYSFGTGTNTDRALGSIGSGTPDDLAWGVVIKNDSAVPLLLTTISYTGEQWRKSGVTTAQTMNFSYQIATSAITNLTPGSDTGWTDISALGFTSKVNTTTGASLDGNLAANKTVLSDTPNIMIPAGSFITLRWRDIDHSGADHGLSTDDFSATFALPVPEPSTALLGAIGSLALLRRRR